MRCFRIIRSRFAPMNPTGAQYKDRSLEMHDLDAKITLDHAIASPLISASTLEGSSPFSARWKFCEP